MKTACWTLLVVSVVLFLAGSITRFGPAPVLAGVAAGTYWKAAMGLLGYAVALKVLSIEGTRPA